MLRVSIRRVTPAKEKAAPEEKMRQQQRCWQSSLPALGKLTSLPARQSSQQCRSLFTAARLGGCPPKARSGPTGLRLAMPPRSSLGRAPLRSFANESREDIAARQQDLKNFVGGGNKAAATKPASGEAGQVMEGGLAAWFWIFPAITVYRWQEKKEMIRYRKERLLEPTVDLPPHLTDETLRDFEFRHVEVSGKFDPVREFVVRPRTRDGQNGGLLLTPFRRSDDGTIVLVNRGWIPAALMNDIVQRRAMLDRVSGDTRLFGLIRPGEKLASIHTTTSREAEGLFVQPVVEAARKDLLGRVVVEPRDRLVSVLQQPHSRC
ncbi:uncharacterized protein ACA1_330400 [Acanthamoeba castellanii str. Neff]|uniref:SURF1-like protein n=1 Tax=Acanthamoeba castellanii (strain ATCC 30010 / Neff) TaxID=1257118 RepID=L8GJV9_ACACF|nr:uncharacterized protein ACA1_330400 [Acanthamoeba castellanii str. Neff]ELR12476.1 hypothetical protein ACA1_330400 [Acanthamoeba castellanii str. Neff]